ncbi:uncharacterized protein [Porites lutea]|uniref:uncharacterized protein n=1 Tax=Porites lutea TaxID=51062 RepID=UPI003CC5FD8B
MVELLAQGGFNLTKFMSNCKRLLSAVPNDKRSEPNLNLDMDDLPIERALGIRWSVEDDTLGFEIRSLVRPRTKCGILSTVCSLFDSLGFAAPVALSARCLVQDLLKANIGLDEPLSEEFLSKSRAWNTELPLLSELSIPRSYFPSDGDPRQCKLQVHVISDASEIGCGASSYLRSEYPDGRAHCTFIIDNARNAPVKFVSIPRLELQAAVLTTQMFKMWREELELNISRTYLWTDSEIVLNYLKNEKRRLQTFVANRVKEIKEHTLLEDWHHVSGSLDPADYVSRGMSPSSLTADHRCLCGPDFLWKPETCRPTDKCQSVPHEGLELKKEALVHSVQRSLVRLTRRREIRGLWLSKTVKNRPPPPPECY